MSGKYRLEHRLGGGGMAEVFLGSSVGAEGFSRRVAIKRVLPGYSENQAFAQMFVAEAQISSQLVHPNIVSVLDFDRDPEGRLFLVMELVEGKDLDALVTTGVLPLPVVIFVIAEVLRGLGHAHDLPVGNAARGVVHRDISPHNVLLSWSGAVKVSDFGIAKARAASAATASVFIKGKPAYMSPEQANGQALDGRSDLFAVGIMLWEMLVGRRLFTGEDTRATLAAVLFGQIPRPRALRGDLPKDLERVTMKLLERDLPARYATAEHALHELLACADAPKDGRELLVRVLAERFPNEAPVRQSLLRARSQGSPGSLPPTPVGAIGSEPAVAAAAMPSLGAARNATTATLDLHPPGRRGRLPLPVIGAVVVVASAAATFALVSAVKGGDDAPAAIRDGAIAAAPPADAAPAGATVPIDAAPAAVPPVDAPAPAAPVDAAPAPAPADAAPTRPPPEPRYGSLYVTTVPVVTVYIDGKRIGDTPRRVDHVRVGRHSVRLVNPDAGIRVTRTVTIREHAVEELHYKQPKP